MEGIGAQSDDYPVSVLSASQANEPIAAAVGSDTAQTSPYVALETRSPHLICSSIRCAIVVRFRTQDSVLCVKRPENCGL